MSKKDIAVYTALLVCLTIAVLIHFSIVKNRTALESLSEAFKKKEEKPLSPKHLETKTRVTLREIKEPSPKRAKKTLQGKKTKVANKRIIKKQLSKRVTVSTKLLDAGQEMIGKTGENLGKYPSFVVDYRKTLGFRRYARSLLHIGGRFFVMDMNNKKLKAEIDIESGRLKKVENLERLSPRSRTISNESETDSYIRTAQNKYGYSRYSVVLLLPLIIDSLLVAGMEKSLKELNLSNSDFFCFQGLYRKERAGLILNITSGRKKDGKTMSFDIAFNLSKASMI